ncbi:dentin sialophosphoprotein isoform X2 [Drosophila ananassae]|uniref:dentin sialophosphoprotein isoform X2 n=1 Tax=Drosophila ananassae TaxID=7217 RepID=UPI0013A5C1A2|nr:dentin sialophosphoprotein isoform X2 [Drosophila ananassae]
MNVFVIPRIEYEYELLQRNNQLQANKTRRKNGRLENNHNARKRGKNQRTTKQQRRILEEVTHNSANSHATDATDATDASDTSDSPEVKDQVQHRSSIGFGELLHEIRDHHNSIVGQEHQEQEEHTEARQGQRNVEDETATEEQKQKAVGALSLITNSFDVQDFGSLVAHPVDSTVSGITSTSTSTGDPDNPYNQDPILYRVVRTELFRQAIEDEEQLDQLEDGDDDEEEDKESVKEPEEQPCGSRTLEADLQPSTSRQGRENVPPKRARGRKRVKALVHYSPLSEDNEKPPKKRARREKKKPTKKRKTSHSTRRRTFASNNYSTEDDEDQGNDEYSSSSPPSRKDKREDPDNDQGGRKISGRDYDEGPSTSGARKGRSRGRSSSHKNKKNRKRSAGPLDEEEYPFYYYSKSFQNFMLSRQSPNHPAKESPKDRQHVEESNKENNRAASNQELIESPHVQVRDIDLVLRVIDLTGSSPESNPIGGESVRERESEPESEPVPEPESEPEPEPEFEEKAEERSSPSYMSDCDDSCCQSEAKSDVESHRRCSETRTTSNASDTLQIDLTSPERSYQDLEESVIEIDLSSEELDELEVEPKDSEPKTPDSPKWTNRRKNPRNRRRSV